MPVCVCVRACVCVLVSVCVPPPISLISAQLSRYILPADETVTTKPEDVKDLPAVPVDTCSAKDLTSSTTHPTTTQWWLRTSTSDEGTAVSATATKEQRSDTRKTNTTLTPEAADSTQPASKAAQPNTQPTHRAETNAALNPEAETNTTLTAEAETSAALMPEAADSTQPVSEAAQPNTQPTDRAETNASASTPAARSNTPPSPGALQATAPATAEADPATSATRAAATDTRPLSGVGPSGLPMAEPDGSDRSTSEANDASPPTMQEQPATDLSSQWKVSTTGHSPPKHAAGEFETENSVQLSTL